MPIPKNLFPLIVWMILILAGCSAPKTLTMTPDKPPLEESHIQIYTDDQVAEFLVRFPSLEANYYGTPSPVDVLRELDIKLERLALREHHVGDCYDVKVYDLSPGYTLLVDENVCFGVRVSIEKK